MHLQRLPSWCARVTRSLLLPAGLLLAAATPAQAQVVVSQVYGGGGNTGAQYKNDFIELFNAGTATVDLTGWSVQYASATGTTWQVTAVSGSLQPGQYLLVQEGAGANTAATPLPSPDASGSIAMSGTAGKVALSNTITALAGACPAAQNLVAFGAANCPTPTATLSNTTAALRKASGCTNTGNNGADFEVLAPAPRNRASALHPCDGGGTPTSPTATAALSPSSVQAGEGFTLRVTVVPGTNPASTGLVVIADLQAIGGAANQPLYDDGTHGDAVAGDKVFSLATSVAAGTSAGNKALGIGVGDDQLRSASLAATLSVVQLVAIHDVQGSGNTSPLAGQTVVTEGIVTARKTNGFFLQAADGEADGNPATSEGVFVFTSSAPSATATVGNRVRVQAAVSEFVSASNPHQLTITELTSPVLSLLSTGNPLPAPVEVTAALANPASAIDSLERLEGMRVGVPTLRVVAPVGAFINEANATSPPDGVFFGVVPGVARPFREPGVGALDTTAFPAGVTPPVFDTNPERIRIQSTGQAGAVALGADVGDVVTGLVGVLDYGFGVYSLLPDPAAAIAVTPGASPAAVSVAKSSEITIGGFNLERFFDDVNAPGISDPVLTPVALENRMKKTANAICGYVRTPDILGVVEVENLPVLQQLAQHINAGNTLFPGSCAKDPQYVAYLEEGNDVGGIDIGFLVNGTEVAPGVKRVEVLGVEQIGKASTFANPDGSTSLLNDRPSLVLRARVNQANGAHYDVTVIANHLRSLTDVNSVAAGGNGWATDGARIRAKRAAQAKEVADFVQAEQAAHPGERLVLLGDFNAFEFNDGYTDSMGIITGREAGPSEVLNYVDSPVSVPLTNMASLSPEAERYSFSFDGNAQSLDHMVVNQALLDSTTGVRAEHARINSDFGEDNYGDFTVPVRVSDHDPVVLFLGDAAFATADLAATVQAQQASVVIGQPAVFGVGVANGGPDAAAPVSLDLTLDLAREGVSVSAASGWTCNAPVVLAASTTVHCAAGTLASGANDGFTVSVPTDRSLGGRALSLSAQVVSPMTDPAPANNQGSAAVQVTASADLAAIVLAPKGPLPAKKPAQFAIGIANAGPHDARNAVLVIAVSGPKQVVSGISGALACSNATDTATLSTWTCPAGDWYAAGRFDGVVVTVNPSYSAGPTLSVGAGFSSDTSDPAPGNNQSGAAVKVVGPTVTLQ
jgi:predicted extracellular nuclease